MDRIMATKPSPTALIALMALFVALIALFIALGGIAEGLPGKQSVDKNDLKRNVVKSRHIADGQVSAGDLNGPIPYYGANHLVAPMAAEASHAVCPAGYKVTGGGWEGDLSDATVMYNAPMGTPPTAHRDWYVAIVNNSAYANQEFRAVALCVRAAP